VWQPRGCGTVVQGLTDTTFYAEDIKRWLVGALGRTEGNNIKINHKAISC